MSLTRSALFVFLAAVVACGGSSSYGERGGGAEAEDEDAPPPASRGRASKDDRLPVATLDAGIGAPVDVLPLPTIPAPAVPTMPAIDGGAATAAKRHPRIRVAHAEGDWLYVEWDIVEDADADAYRLFVVVRNRDGSNGEFVSERAPFARDRGAFRYTYVHRSLVCDAAARTKDPQRPISLYAQVWPGDDSTRAENAEVTGSLVCL